MLFNLPVILLHALSNNMLYNLDIRKICIKKEILWEHKQSFIHLHNIRVEADIQSVFSKKVSAKKNKASPVEKPVFLWHLVNSMLK